jgi:hypothetical protein
MRERGDKRNGEEDCQGREEEGRQEAVSPFTRLSTVHRGFHGAPYTASLLPSGPVPNSYPHNRIAWLDAVDDFHSIDHLTERRIARIQVRLW